jgi:hypothetical protein
MRVIGWNSNLVQEIRPKLFNGPTRRVVIRIARNGDGSIKLANERRNRPARLERITVPAKRRQNSVSDVAGANSHVIGVAHAEIEVTDIRTIRKQNAELIRRHKTTRRKTGNQLDE